MKNTCLDITMSGHVPVILALRRLRQEDLQIKASPNYKVSSKPADLHNQTLPQKKYFLIKQKPG
jgi:hypothetical protein